MIAVIDTCKSEVREATPFHARISPAAHARRLPALSSRRAASLIRRTAKLIRRPSAFVLMGAVSSAAGCDGKVDLESSWRTEDVFVYGANTEWQGATTYFEDEKLFVGLQNDDEYLYLALFVADRSTQAQVAMRGCTVWFDPSGKGEREFGVRYPLGARLGGRGGERPFGPGGGFGGGARGRGGSGGRPGGMGERRGGEIPEPPSPLEVWASVKLAAGPATD